MIALDECARLESERIKNMAIAVRAGFTNEESWEAFLKENQSSS